MPKESLKREGRARQNNIDPLTGEELDPENYKVDTHREPPKRKGGDYTKESTIITLPLPHMGKHGTLRIRSEVLEDLKAKVDDREQIMKLRNKLANQLRAYDRRTDYLSAETRQEIQALLDNIEPKLKIRTELVKNAILEYAETDPLARIALGVIGIGEITVAYLTAYLDFEKARHVSSFWKYAGLHAASHERYVKGKTSGGNRSLRTALWNTATSIEKNMNSPYRIIYDRVKARLSISEKITKTRNTEGNLITSAWKDTKPGHRQGAAKRAIMKAILADYWFVGRKTLGLPVTPLYAETMLGKDGHKTVDPESRGWVLVEVRLSKKPISLKRARSPEKTKVPKRAMGDKKTNAFKRTNGRKKPS